MRVSLQGAIAVASEHPAIPKAERIAVKTWGLVAGIVMIAGIVYAFVGGWYWAPIAIVASLAIAQANRQSAADFVRKAAEFNPAFKQQMLQARVIIDP
jgi:hypothetical protein